MILKLIETSKRTGNHNILNKFKNLARSKGKIFSYDWDAELDTFLDRERSESTNEANIKNVKEEHAPRSAVNRMEFYVSERNIIKSQ